MDFHIYNKYSHGQTFILYNKVTNLQKYYFNKKIDIFECIISVPGFARQMFFESARIEGPCFP